MPIVVRCPGCGQEYSISRNLAADSITCKVCNAVIRTPHSERPSRQRSTGAELPELLPADDYGEDDERVRRVARNRRRSQPPDDGNRRLLVILGIVGGGAVLAVTVLIVVLITRRPANNNPAGNAAAAGSREQADGPRNAVGQQPGQPIGPAPAAAIRKVSVVGKRLAAVPLPAFPPLPKPRLLDRGGMRVAFVNFAADAANRDGPGQRMTLRIYYPRGEYQEKTLGCILVAPGETNWLHGFDVDAGTYHAETRRYVTYQFLVVYYSLDGALNNWSKATDAERATAYNRFKAAHAGLVNARNALEYVLKEVPEVDPNRIYCAGHASAGTLALLLAAHEPRIRACIAYAPATDLSQQVKTIADDGRMQRLLPDLRGFLRDYSPETHSSGIRCPVFLFHARDDHVIPFRSTLKFVTQMNEQKQDLKTASVLRGGYYHAMINPGMSQAMRWLVDQQRERDARRVNPRPRIVRFQLPEGEPRRELRFRVVINVRNGADPNPYIRRALREIDWLDPGKVVYDARAREIVIPYTGRRNIGNVGKALLKARIQILSTSTGFAPLF